MRLALRGHKDHSDGTTDHTESTDESEGRGTIKRERRKNHKEDRRYRRKHKLLCVIVL
jgi:hypothetical protein